MASPEKKAKNTTPNIAESTDETPKNELTTSEIGKEPGQEKVREAIKEVIIAIKQ